MVRVGELVPQVPVHGSILRWVTKGLTAFQHQSHNQNLGTWRVARTQWRPLWYFFAWFWADYFSTDFLLQKLGLIGDPLLPIRPDGETRGEHPETNVPDTWMPDFFRYERYDASADLPHVTQGAKSLCFF